MKKNGLIFHANRVLAQKKKQREEVQQPTDQLQSKGVREKPKKKKKFNAAKALQQLRQAKREAKRKQKFEEAGRTENKTPRAIVHITTTWNNTIISLTDRRGRVLLWSSAGVQRGIAGCKKKTPYANKLATDEIIKLAKRRGVRKLGIVFSGPGKGRREAVRKFVRIRYWKITKIRNQTGIPHGGCRPRKRPRRRRRHFKG